MSLTIKETATYVPPPSGTHYARCFGVIDLGTQPDDRFGSRAKVMLMFELPHERIKFIDNGVEKERPISISKEYGATLGKKSDLRKHLNAWRGRPFTEEELKGFLLDNVLGVPCTLSIVHKPKFTGGVAARIETVVAVPKGTTVPELWHKSVSFDIEQGSESESFKSLPEWVQNKIAKCIEWNADTPPNDSDAHDDDEGDVPF